MRGTDKRWYFRSAAGVLVSDAKGRDVKIDSYTLSFHGRLLIEGAEVSLNYGQRYFYRKFCLMKLSQPKYASRYGLLGENGSGKVKATLL